MSLDDHGRVIRYAEMLFPSPDGYRSFVVDGIPCSKARPRFGKNGAVYSPTKAKERALSWVIKQSFSGPLLGNVYVICIFYRPNRQRIDADNLMKHFLDAATGVCWVDDSQVTAQLGIVEYDAHRPRTVVCIGDHDSTMVRDANREHVCAQCGCAFTSVQHKPKYCSRACSSRSRGRDLRGLVSCAGCGVDFKRRTSGQRFCSDDCRMASLVEKTAKPAALCKCGQVLSKRGYGMCRACYKAQVTKKPAAAAA